jgi:diguanylate cyclase (GGDEF)-like protein
MAQTYRKDLAPPSRWLYGAVAALASALLALLFATYLVSERQAQFRLGADSARQIAESTALAAEGSLDATRNLLRAMAALSTLSRRLPGAAAQIPEWLMEWKRQMPYLMDLLVVAPDGRILQWTGTGQPPQIADRPYVTAHTDAAAGSGGKLHVGEPLRSRVHAGRWFFALSEGVRDSQQRLTHVVVAIIDAALLKERVSVAFAVPNSSQALLSERGDIYLRVPDYDQHVGKRVVRPEQFGALSERSPATAFRAISQVDGRERLIALRLLHGYPLVASGTIDADSLLAPWRLSAALLAGLWLLLTTAIFWGTRQLYRIAHAQAELASVDELTGTLNRRSILSTGALLERSATHAGALSLLMIDADHFKSINDRFGHVVGDEVLRQLSELLRRNIRASDIVGRYGGEEFLVLMPDTGEEGALQVAEKLRAAVERGITRPVPLTVSIGVATSRGSLTLERALALADEALYVAKAAGRNCVRVGGGTAAASAA